MYFFIIGVPEIYLKLLKQAELTVSTLHHMLARPWQIQLSQLSHTLHPTLRADSLLECPTTLQYVSYA